MSNIRDATCDANSVVKAEGFEVDTAVILSEGKQASTGVILMQDDKQTYITSNATDIKTTIEKVCSALDDIESALQTIAGTLTSIAAGMTGSTTAPPPTLPDDVAEIVSKIIEITTTRSELNSLKRGIEMTDIVSADEDGLVVYDTQVSKAANILSVQLGSLEYASDLGIDLQYFLSDDLRFQNASFKAYLVERLANSGINVSAVIETIENLFSQYTFNITPEETTTGLIAR